MCCIKLKLVQSDGLLQQRKQQEKYIQTYLFYNNNKGYDKAKASIFL